MRRFAGTLWVLALVPLAACGGGGADSGDPGLPDGTQPDAPVADVPLDQGVDPETDEAALDTGDPGEPGDPGPDGPSFDPQADDAPDVPLPGGLDLPPGAAATLDAIVARLASLRAEQGIASARTTLMAQLDDGWTGLAWARLGPDGTTISLGFEGGSSAVLVTDEDVFAPVDRARAGALPTPGRPTRLFRAPAGPGQALACGDAIAPPNRKVHIVNLAGGGTPGSVKLATDMEAFLLSLGWTRDEITVTQRLAREDRSVTPDTVFQQEAYGMVLFIAHGGVRVDDAGTEHYILQGFLGGKREDGYQDVVTQQRWDEYKQWYADGLAVTGQSWSQVDKAFVKDVYLRDDLLADQVQLEPGALVSFIACNSARLDDELASAGAGPVLGWDDSVDGDDGLAAWKALFTGLADPSLGTADEALARMVKDGTAFSENTHGTVAQMILGGDPRDWTLPGSMVLDAPDDCLPAGTDHLEVKVRFPECPDADVAFDLPPDGSRTLSPLVPTGAEVELRAKDATGKTLGAALRGVAVVPGQAVRPDLCPCAGTLALDVTDFPEDGSYTATSLDVQVEYADTTVGGASFSASLPSPTLEGLVPGYATLSLTARAANGDVLGTATVQAAARCDPAPPEAACFGWVELACGNPPADTTQLTVTAPGHAHALPPSRSFAPGESARMYGFAVGETVRFAVEARNAAGVLVGTANFAGTVGCGATPVEVDFALYAIRVAATPTRLHADGASAAAVVATLRRWRTDDLFEPTGDLLAGKAVAFDTSCGTFAGPTGGVSDAQGRVTTSLSSTEPCLAAVRAFAAEDGIESRPTYVNFDKRMSFWINGSATSVQSAAPSGIFPVSCAKGRFYFRGVLMTEERVFAMENLGWGMYVPNTADPGDKVRLEFAPTYEGEHCGDAEHSVGPVWVHLAYPPDFVHQRTFRLSPYVHLGGPVSMESALDEIDYYVP